MLLTGGRGPHGGSRSGFSTLLESSLPRPLNLSCPYRTDTNRISESEREPWAEGRLGGHRQFQRVKRLWPRLLMGSRAPQVIRPQSAVDIPPRAAQR